MIGKRGRKVAPLPDYVETASDGKVRCSLCLEFNKREYKGKWVLKASLSNHATHPVHLKSVENQIAFLAGKDDEIPENYATSRDVVMDSPPRHRASTNTYPSQANDEEETMWNSFDGNFEFDISGADLHERKHKDFDHRLKEYGLWDGLETLPDDDMFNIEQIWQEDEQDELLSELLESSDIEEQGGETEDMTESSDHTWFPYPSKLAFLLDTIDNLPRLRISTSFMKVLLWLLREVGVKNVPSFDGLRKVQRNLKREKIVPTVHWKSPKGHTFSFNDPRAIIANDWANPLVAKHIHRYPVIARDGIISEIWHGQKLRHDLDRHLMSPMYDAGNGKHYFIDEPAHLKDGRMIIPVRWLEDDSGAVYCDAWEITVNGQSVSKIEDEIVVMIAASDLKYNMLDLEDMSLMPEWSLETIASRHVSRMPNPDRALAGGIPIYSAFIDIFGDNVSGNRSKSWNKHWNIYITHRNLPRKLLFQQCHIHFTSTSTHTSVPEQFHGIKEVIEKTHHKPIRTRSAVDGQEICLKLYCNCGPGDNPAQSEVCGHIGAKGNYPCRKCNVGGPQKEKETDQGFHDFFLPGKARTAQETLSEVETQVKAACLGVAQTVKDLQTNSGVKDLFTQHWIDELIERSRAMQKSQPQRPLIDIQDELMKWIAEKKTTVYNPFLTLIGFDVSSDTPVEILHTILLGIVKYIWYLLHSTWKDTHKKIYSERLQATNTSGLSIHAIRANYIMQYANSLIGRQLKTLAQVNAFHVYDLVEPLQFALTKAIGELSALLWFQEIRNLDEYLADVDTAAANVLDIAALIDPSKFILKIKYHLLTHLHEDIIRFGPLLGVGTETFECFNAIFRFCSILSNHLAPSRDIALQLAEQEVLRHFLSGGGWRASTGVEWKEPAPAVTSFLGKNPFLVALLGYGHHGLTQPQPPGNIKLEPLKRSKKQTKIACVSLSCAETLAAQAGNTPEMMQNPEVRWYRGKHVVSHAQDECTVGTWIFARSPFSLTEPPVTGKILEILQDEDMTMAFVVIDVFQVSAVRHEYFGMPVLSRPLDKTTFLVIPATTIMFQYNAQHDCRQAQCIASGKRAVLQERVQTELREPESFIRHNPLDRFLINTHAFHNAHLIRAVLPRDLTIPIAYTANRITHHFTIAAKLREIQDGKRLITAEKKKATANQKKVEDGDGTAGIGNGKKRRRDDIPMLGGSAGS